MKIDIAFSVDGFHIVDACGTPGEQCVEWLSFIESWADGVEYLKAHPETHPLLGKQ
jgi:hypothetical protein